MNDTTAPEGEDTTSHSLVAGCNIGHKLHTFHFRAKLKKTEQKLKFSQTISDIIGCSNQADVCSGVCFSDKSGFILLFEARKTG